MFRRVSSFLGSPIRNWKRWYLNVNNPFTCITDVSLIWRSSALSSILVFHILQMDVPLIRFPSMLISHWWENLLWYHSNVFSSSGQCWFPGICMVWGKYTLVFWGKSTLKSAVLSGMWSTSHMTSLSVPLFTKVRDGDLELSCLRWTFPMPAYCRLSSNQSRLWSLMRAQNGTILSSKPRICSYFKSDLYSRCDGAGVAQSSCVAVAHSWVADGSYLFESLRICICASREIQVTV